MRRLSAPIAARLFAAVLVAFAAVGFGGLMLVRWRLHAPMPEASNGDAAFMQALADDLLRRYARRDDWSFVPSTEPARTAWWAAEISGLRGGAGDGASAALPPRSALLPQRLALLDERGKLVAGAVPGRLLIALASIDSQDKALTLHGRIVGTLRLSKADTPADELAIAFLLTRQKDLLWLAGASAALAAVAAALLAAGFRRPIHRLCEAARAMAQGDLAVRSGLRRRDELGDLGSAFDTLAARLQAMEHVRRQWVADTSHELRTPLSVLQGQVDALLDGVHAPTAQRLEGMQRSLQQLKQLVDDLHQLARLDAEPALGGSQAVNLAAALRDVLTGFEPRFAEAGLRVDVIVHPGQLMVAADLQRLRQVFTNLAENAVRHTWPGGSLRVTVERQGRQVAVIFDDSEPGVPADLMHRLGERFFRVDPSRQRGTGGAGLGLALCKRIVEAHGGRLATGPSPLGGLRVTILLPLLDGAAHG